MEKGEINKYVEEAKKMFGFDNKNEDLFTKIININDYEEKYKIILLKEDIGRLSGFISYIKGYAVICINFNRPIAHQNFTLAHELGHFFMHRNTKMDDSDANVSNSNDQIEKDANDFASLLLYPDNISKQKNEELKLLYQEEKYKELADTIDKICREYFISFDFVLRKLAFYISTTQKIKYQKIHDLLKKGIDKALKCNISQVYEKDFYTVNNDLPNYQKYNKPYENFIKDVEILIENDKISKATGESLLYENEMLGE